MITIIHGDNITASRNELTRAKEAAKGKEIRDVNGKDISESELRQAVESLSLFGNTILIVLENVFSGLGRKEKQIKLFADILSQAGETVDIVIWESKEMGKTVLSSLPTSTVRLFKTPAIIFEFLDACKTNNTETLLGVLEKTAETVPMELILYMLQMRLRQLIQIKDAITPEKMSPWQTMRLTNQAKSFTMNKLLAMHQQLIDMEYALKTGSTPLTLRQLITQYCIDL